MPVVPTGQTPQRCPTPASLHSGSTPLLPHIHVNLVGLLPPLRGHTVFTVIRVSTEVRFWLSTEYGIFWKTYGIPPNSAEFRGILCSKIYRNSAEFRGIPFVFAYGISHVTKWSRFQISPWIKNKKCWTNCTNSKYPRTGSNCTYKIFPETFIYHSKIMSS